MLLSIKKFELFRTVQKWFLMNNKLECFMVEPSQPQSTKKIYRDIFFWGRSFSH